MEALPRSAATVWGGLECSSRWALSLATLARRLYVMKAILHVGQRVDEPMILGALSCIIWTLTLQTTVKYVLVALRADNHGEGGILALYALLRRHKRKWIYLLALMGAGTLLADGIITPAITVTTAIEGLESVSPHLPVLPITLGHHHRRLLRTALRHGEHRQVVWWLHAAVVSPAGCGRHDQPSLLSAGDPGAQSLLCPAAAGDVARVVSRLGRGVSLYYGCGGALFRLGTLWQAKHHRELGLCQDDAHPQLSRAGSVDPLPCRRGGFGQSVLCHHASRLADLFPS